MQKALFIVKHLAEAISHITLPLTKRGKNKLYKIDFI